MIEVKTVSFNNLNDERYPGMIEALKRSFSKNMKSAKFEVMDTEFLPIRQKIDRKGFHDCQTNNYKLKVWNKAVQNATSDLILLDADMFCRGDLSKVFDQDFDIAYTTRTSGQPPINGGVIFVKNTIKAKQFFKEWTAADDRMLADIVFHDQYRTRYKGMNQSSFGYMLENRKLTKAILHSLPCAEYNACVEDWPNFKKAKLVHLNGFLGNDVLSRPETMPEWETAFFKEYDPPQKKGKSVDVDTPEEDVDANE